LDLLTSKVIKGFADVVKEVRMGGSDRSRSDKELRALLTGFKSGGYRPHESVQDADADLSTEKGPDLGKGSILEHTIDGAIGKTLLELFGGGELAEVRGIPVGAMVAKAVGGVLKKVPGASWLAGKAKSLFSRGSSLKKLPVKALTRAEAMAPRVLKYVPKAGLLAKYAPNLTRMAGKIPGVGKLGGLASRLVVPLTAIANAGMSTYANTKALAHDPTKSMSQKITGIGAGLFGSFGDTLTSLDPTGLVMQEALSHRALRGLGAVRGKDDTLSASMRDRSVDLLGEYYTPKFDPTQEGGRVSDGLRRQAQRSLAKLGWDNSSIASIDFSNLTEADMAQLTKLNRMAASAVISPQVKPIPTPSPELPGRSSVPLTGPSLSSNVSPPLTPPPRGVPPVPVVRTQIEDFGILLLNSAYFG